MPACHPVAKLDVALSRKNRRGRSAEKNDGTPRWAYLRSTCEELRRFAVAHGLPQTVCDRLGSTYGELVPTFAGA